MPSAMHWEKRLAYTINPKSGPMRSMETLLDANRGLSRDLLLAVYPPAMVGSWEDSGGGRRDRSTWPH